MNAMKFYRLSAGISQLLASRRLAIHPSRLSKLENNWSVPRESELEKMAKLYRVTRKELKQPKEICIKK